MQQGFQSGGQKGSERNQRPKSSDRCLPSGKDLDKCVWMLWHKEIATHRHSFADAIYYVHSDDVRCVEVRAKKDSRLAAKQNKPEENENENETRIMRFKYEQISYEQQ